MALAKPRKQVEVGDLPTIKGAPSVLGPYLHVDGGLSTKGELTVEGRVTGDIQAGRFILQPGGHVEGNVIAQEALIHGYLDGRVIAPTVKVGVEATVLGKVFHHTITVAEGARLDARFPWRPMNYFTESQYELQEAKDDDVHA
jgi:cytoskeletal protein CcmA (bactofilin family)